MVFQDEYLTPMNINYKYSKVCDTNIQNVLWSKTASEKCNVLEVNDQFVPNEKNPHSKHLKIFLKTHKRYFKGHESSSVIFRTHFMLWTRNDMA